MLHLSSPYQLCPCGIVHREAFSDQTAWRREFQGFWMVDALKNIGLDAMAGAMDFTSVHSAFSLTGGNELASVSYVRFSNTWGSAASGAVALASTFPSFSLTAGDVAAWVGLFSASSAGTFYGMQAAGAETLKGCSVETATDLTNNDIFSDAHGYSAGNRVVFWPASDVTLPTGLSVGTIYWVIGTGIGTDSFRVSTSSGGSAVDITTDAPSVFFVQRCAPETFANDGTFSVTSFNFDLAGLL